MAKREQKGQLYWLEKYGWHGRRYAGRVQMMHSRGARGTNG